MNLISPPRRLIDASIDGVEVRLPEGTTILEGCRALGIETPTLCYLENLAPVNVCRVCVVELKGSRVLVPACSRRLEAGMEVATDSERVRASRRMVLELLGSAADLSLTPEVAGWRERYDARPGRFGNTAEIASSGAPPKVDNDLYVRDYSKCILCYKCVEACGEEAQSTFAIAVAGRGFEAGIATEFEVPLPESACVYCGNCIGVCPTGALMFRSEYEMRQMGAWDAGRQQVTRTVCPYCGVGCNLELHVQDNEIVKVTSPLDHDVTSGHLCIKGRFGYAFVQRRGDRA